MKWNESGFRPPLCTYRLNWAGELPEDGEMIEMTLSSRHRIRNSNPGGLRPSTLPLSHGGSSQYWLSHVDGGETFFAFFKPRRPGTEPRTLAWKAVVLTTTLGPPPISPGAKSEPGFSFRFKVFLLKILHTHHESIFTLLESIPIMFKYGSQNGFWELFFRVHFPCVPNDYHSHLLKNDNTHRSSFLSSHSLIVCNSEKKWIFETIYFFQFLETF